MNRIASLLCICVLTAVGCGHREQVSLADVEALKARVEQLEQQIAKPMVIEEGQFRRVVIVDEAGVSRIELSRTGVTVSDGTTDGPQLRLFTADGTAAVDLKAGEARCVAAATNTAKTVSVGITGLSGARQQFDLGTTVDGAELKLGTTQSGRVELTTIDDRAVLSLEAKDIMKSAITIKAQDGKPQILTLPIAIPSQPKGD